MSHGWIAGLAGAVIGGMVLPAVSGRSWVMEERTTPFADVSEGMWCGADGACWAERPRGLRLDISAAPYASIGLEEGDILASVNGRRLRDWDDLSRAAAALEKNGAACLTVHRERSTLSMGVVVPDARESGQTLNAAWAEDPCAAWRAEEAAEAEQLAQRRAAAAAQRAEREAERAARKAQDEGTEQLRPPTDTRTRGASGTCGTSRSRKSRRSRRSE